MPLHIIIRLSLQHKPQVCCSGMPSDSARVMSSSGFDVSAKEECHWNASSTDTQATGPQLWGCPNWLTHWIMQFARYGPGTLWWTSRILPMSMSPRQSSTIRDTVCGQNDYNRNEQVASFLKLVPYTQLWANGDPRKILSHHLRQSN